jgi:hypothetical protein
MTDDDARMRLLVNEPVLGGAKFVSKLDSYIPEASTANSRRGFFVYSQKLHSHIPECRGSQQPIRGRLDLQNGPK